MKFPRLAAPRRARHAAAPVKETVMHQPDVLPSPLTQADAQYVAEREAGATAEAARLRAEARSLLAMADMWDDVANAFRSRLAGPVSLLPPTPTPAPQSQAEPDPQPLEAALLAARAEQARLTDDHPGRDPYPPTTPMPRVEGFVQVNGYHPSEPVAGGAR